MKIGIIGCGNMGSALVTGMIQQETFTHYEISAYDMDEEKLEDISSRLKLHKSKNEKELVAKCDIIILAVKPADVAATLKKVAGELDVEDKILITIAAGLKVSLYRGIIKKAKIVRVMPNTPAIVGKGASVLFFDGELSEKKKNTVLSIFKACGTAEIIHKEELMDCVTGLSGSGPAYVFTFINSLADAGVMEGLSRDLAIRLAIQTVLGSAELASLSYQNDGTHLEELKDRVTSPGGTTAAGLFALETGAFRATVMSAVKSAVNRSKELGAK